MNPLRPHSVKSDIKLICIDETRLGESMQCFSISFLFIIFHPNRSESCEGLLKIENGIGMELCVENKKNEEIMPKIHGFEMSQRLFVSEALKTSKAIHMAL